MKRMLCLFMLAGLMMASCQVAPFTPIVAPSAASKNQAAADNNAFAFDLYARLHGAEGNLFFSPGSISTALAMTYAGARGNTADEMARVMHFSLEQEKLHPAFAALLGEMNGDGVDPAKRGYQLALANALWGQAGYPWKEDFLYTTKSNYGAGFHPVNFGDAKINRTINAWVEKQTRSRIKDLIPDGLLTSETRLVLTNAIYFKGDWLHQFKKDDTRDHKFFVSAGRIVQTPLMQREDKYRLAAIDNLQVLELPYKGKDLSMFVLLPTRKDGLADLEKSLSAAKFDEYLKLASETEVAVILPKFKIEKTLPLATILQQMGMTTAFDRSRANFQGMTDPSQPGGNLFISEVRHKAFVEVNEEGAEAAAATAVEVLTFSAKPAPPVFRADHPFMFVIRDNRNGSILFMGRVVDPTAK